MKYKTILLDIDGTILDFSLGENYAINKVFKQLNINPSLDNINKYLEINHKWWLNFEQGKCDKQTLLVNRFKEFFAFVNVEADGKLWNELYLSYLSEQIFYIDNAIEFMEYICKHYDVYFVTNGVKNTQMKRLEKTPFLSMIKGVFVSEEVGYQKPKVEYFDYVKKVTGFDNDKTIIIGDSETSDIQGGINYGIDTCLYTKSNTLPKLTPTYIINDLLDFIKLDK